MKKPFPSSSLYAAVSWPDGEPRPLGHDVPDEDETAYIVDDYLTLCWLLERCAGEGVWFHTRLDAWNDPERDSDFQIVNLVMSKDCPALCPVLPTMRYLPDWIGDQAERGEPWPVKIPGEDKAEQEEFVSSIGDRIRLSIDVRLALERGIQR